MTLRDLR